MTRNRESPGAGRDEKARRLAEALRANLRRRKAQAREREAARAAKGGDAEKDKGDT